MFSPVGSQPPSVYWRRRLVLLGAIGLLLVLLILTVKVATSDGSAAPRGGGHTTPAAVNTPVTHISEGPSTTPHSRHSSSSVSTSASNSTSAAPQPCAAKDLAVAAVSTKPNFSVGDEPVLELQVTNNGDAPCVQDLADAQVELKVYNGESRVWGSHDCQTEPGTNPMTLEVGKAVRVAITWSGLSSQPNCAGTRQRVGAGTYTLYAALSGHTGKATQFSLS